MYYKSQPRTTRKQTGYLRFFSPLSKTERAHITKPPGSGPPRTRHRPGNRLGSVRLRHASPSLRSKPYSRLVRRQRSLDVVPLCRATLVLGFRLLLLARHLLIANKEHRLLVLLVPKRAFGADTLAIRMRRQVHLDVLGQLVSIKVVQRDLARVRRALFTILQIEQRLAANNMVHRTAVGLVAAFRHGVNVSCGDGRRVDGIRHARVVLDMVRVHAGRGAVVE